jgi:hypothetical protein
MSCSRRLVPVALLILALFVPYTVRAARSAVAPLSDAGPIFPPSAPFQFPDLGTYNGGVYVRHGQGTTNYAWAMRPSGFSPSSMVDSFYTVETFPSAGQAQASSAHSRQEIEGESSRFGPIRPFAFGATALDDPGLHAWGSYIPSIHCNSSLGFVYRNISFLVSFSSRGNEVCKVGTDWPIGLALRLLQATVVFAHTHAGVPVPSYPPLSYFHLPVNVAGTPPVPYSPVPQERSDQVTFERCNDYRVHVAVLCQNYIYDVIPNVPNVGEVGPHGGQPRQGNYVVSMYDTTDQARQANADERAHGVAYGPDDQPLPLLPIAHPIDNTTEWMRGHAVIGPSGPEGCDVGGGIRYHNVKISAGLFVLFSTRPTGGTPCQPGYNWVTRVLGALYARAAALTADASPSATHTPVVASVLPTVVPALARARTIPIYLPSWLPHLSHRAYPSLSISRNAWQVQLSSDPHCTALYCVDWFVQGRAGVHLRPQTDRTVNLGANGTGYLFLNKGSNSLPNIEWTHDGNTYNTVAITMEASPDQPTLVHIVRSMVRVSQNMASITTTAATPWR